jgi:hypothetical protein
MVSSKSATQKIADGSGCIDNNCNIRLGSWGKQIDHCRHIPNIIISECTACQPIYSLIPNVSCPAICAMELPHRNWCHNMTPLLLHHHHHHHNQPIRTIVVHHHRHQHPPTASYGSSPENSWPSPPSTHTNAHPNHQFAYHVGGNQSINHHHLHLEGTLQWMGQIHVIWKLDYFH